MYLLPYMRRESWWIMEARAVRRASSRRHPRKVMSRPASRCRHGELQADPLLTHQPARPYRLPLEALPGENYGMRGQKDSGLPMMAIM